MRSYFLVVPQILIQLETKMIAMATVIMKAAAAKTVFMYIHVYVHESIYFIF